MGKNITENITKDTTQNITKTITLNGETKQTDKITLSELLAETGIETGLRGIAVAVNSVVVPKVNWGNYFVNNNDEIEVITAMQGG